MPYQQYDVYYWVTPEGKLRHKHLVGGASDFDRPQWHDVDQYHRLNPPVHEDLKAWDINLVGWSEKNYERTRAEKIDLLEKAERAASQNKLLAFDPGYNYPKSTPPAPVEEPELGSDQKMWEARAQKMAEVDVELPPASTPAPAESTGDEIIDMLAALPARVDSLEESRQEHRKHLAVVDSDLSGLRGDIVRVNSRVAEASESGKALNEALAGSIQDISDRLDTLEEAAARHVEITLHRPELPDKVIHLNGADHPKLPELIELVSLLNPEDRNIWIAGPAGSSKTTAAYKLAEALDLEFGYLPAIAQPHEYLGYRNAQGTYISTAFRNLYENGGVCLFDEIDGSNATALLPLNGALSGPQCSFPDGMVKRNPDFTLLCAGNTWGHGSTVEYIGRLAQDAAFLDRFVWIEWPYDEQFEIAISPLPEWTLVVQAIRAAAALQKAKIVISPRASIKGGQLLSRGMSRERVVNAIFGRYRNRIGDWSIIGKAAEDYIKAEPKPVFEARKYISLDEPLSPGPYVPTGSPNGLVKTVDFTGVRVY